MLKLETEGFSTACEGRPGRDLIATHAGESTGQQLSGEHVRCDRPVENQNLTE